MKLKRVLVGPDHPDGPSIGADVVAIKRGLARVKLLYKPHSNVYNSACELAVEKFQGRRGLKIDGVLGQETLDALWPHMDAYARFKYRRFKPITPADQQFNRLMSAMHTLATETPGYLFGGQHGIPLDHFDPMKPSDCSSSVSEVLYQAGMFDGIGLRHVAAVSGQLESWGAAGRGKWFTVYANADHVWIRLYKGPYWRFDTSPHGDGGDGPRLRKLPRFTFGFVARHREGM